MSSAMKAKQSSLTKFFPSPMKADDAEAAMKGAKPTIVKAKRVVKNKSSAGRVKKSTLRSALLSGLKEQGGRKDLDIADAPDVAAKASTSVPIEERGGFPVKLKAGGVHPKDWITAKGVKIMVDFARCPWLPDDWGQGVKQTQPTSHSTGGGGGILTTYVAPDGKSFFHKSSSEKYAGVKFDKETGWNGQVRLAKLQAQQTLKLARAQGDFATKGGRLVGMGSDASFFKILTPAEQKKLPKADEFHFAVVSARRATKLEGVRDIFAVECQLQEAGVTPTWYVDEGSLKDYKALGLKAVVGGKLTASRNKALKDAQKMGKVCVQCSDDISSWEYRDGPAAKVRNDDALNAAYAAAKRLIVSPVAAARFMCAKMRAAEDADGKRPRLAGVYPLGSCARAFFGDSFARSHFILGDFFVVDKDSKLLFDEEMKLKEDYDFTCSHMKAYGSVMRCQRMTLSVKHYANSGGACSNRDDKGKEEQRNIEILHRKWPGCFRSNPKRKNEVIMKWKAASTAGKDVVSDDEDEPVDTKAMKKKTAAVKTKAAPASKSAKEPVQKGKKSASAVIKKIAKKPAMKKA